VDLCARHKRVAQSTRCDRGTKQPANDDSPKIIEETRQYIRDFDRVAGTTTTARELYDKMLELYSDPENPGLALCFRPVRPNRNTSNKNRRTGMHAMRAEKFSGYEGLKLVDEGAASPRQRRSGRGGGGGRVSRRLTPGMLSSLCFNRA